MLAWFRYEGVRCRRDVALVRRLERRQLAWCCSLRVIPVPAFRLRLRRLWSSLSLDPVSSAPAARLTSSGGSGQRSTPCLRAACRPSVASASVVLRFWQIEGLPELSPTCMIAGRRYAEDAECRYASCLGGAAPSRTSRHVSVTSMVLTPPYRAAAALRCFRVSCHSSSGMP